MAKEPTIILGNSTTSNTYLIIDLSRNCDVSIISNNKQICFYTAIESVNYIQVSSLDFPSTEMAMIIASIKLEDGIIGKIRVDHANNTIFFYGFVSKADIAAEFMRRITVNF